jgi:hypothetical protein
VCARYSRTALFESAGISGAGVPARHLIAYLD